MPSNSRMATFDRLVTLAYRIAVLALLSMLAFPELRGMPGQVTLASLQASRQNGDYKSERLRIPIVHVQSVLDEIDVKVTNHGLDVNVTNWAVPVEIVP